MHFLEYPYYLTISLPYSSLFHNLSGRTCVYLCPPISVTCITPSTGSACLSVSVFLFVCVCVHLQAPVIQSILPAQDPHLRSSFPITCGDIPWFALHSPPDRCFYNLKHPTHPNSPSACLPALLATCLSVFKMTKPKSRPCPYCQVINTANRKTCLSCFTSLSTKERVKSKEESLHVGDWGENVKKHRNAGRVIDSARISVNKLHELDLKPLLFMGKEKRGGGGGLQQRPQ
ncbi:uncharacterized protein LOC134015697 isoform X2 [Osmerus eperlanus]|uniref:uncharacterized protein LOC134015697 isoform X2 n=1 Tax=Osmerus eperlanus TaxID=29151 RepID=UPI002E0E1FF9